MIGQMPGLMVGRLEGGMLSVKGINHAWAFPNLTARTNNLLFPPVESGIVYDRSLLVIGRKEAGKTSLANAFATEALRFYGPERLNIVASYSIKQATECMDAKPVQLLIVDDAIMFQDSRRSMGKSNVEDSSDFLRIRHVYEKRFKTLTGAIITVFLSQTMSGLDKRYRSSANAVIFKSVLLDKSDQDEMVNSIDVEGWARLEEIDKAIFEKRRHDMKSWCIVSLASGGNAGYYNYTYEQPWLRFLEPDSEITMDATKQDLFLFDRREEVVRMMKEKDWRGAAKVYYMATFESAKYPRQQDLADALGTKQGIVSAHLKRVRGELSRRAGLEYELFKVWQFENRGYKVDHRGGNGEPDMIITDPTKMEKPMVVSCKCLDFTKESKLDIEEFRPEIVAARALGINGIHLSVYNLATRKEWEMDYNLAQIPTKFIIPL